MEMNNGITETHILKQIQTTWLIIIRDMHASSFENLHHPTPIKLSNRTDPLSAIIYQTRPFCGPLSLMTQPVGRDKLWEL